MIIYSLPYKDNDDLNISIDIINKVIDEGKLKNIDEFNSIIKFKYVKSTNKKVIFKGKIKSNFKEYLIPTLLSFLASILMFFLTYFLLKLIKNGTGTELLEIIIFNVLLTAPFIYFIYSLYRLISNLIFSNKTLVFEKKLFYMPSAFIGSNYLTDFDEIRINKNNHLNHLSFYKSGDLIKFSLTFISDSDEKTHQLIEFAEDYSKKSNTKLTK